MPGASTAAAPLCAVEPAPTGEPEVDPVPVGVVPPVAVVPLPVAVVPPTLPLAVPPAAVLGTLSAESPDVAPDVDPTPVGATPTVLWVVCTVDPQAAVRAAMTAKLVT